MMGECEIQVAGCKQERRLEGLLAPKAPSMPRILLGMFMTV